MDRTMRIILSIAIAIVFPVLLLFSVLFLVPKSENAEYPRYPSCMRREYNQFTREYETNPDCEKQYKEHEKKVDAYDKAREAEEKKNVTRGQIVVGLALLTFIGSFLLRNVKEVAFGLTLGSTIAIMVALSFVVSDMDPPGGIFNSLLAITAFVVLTGLLYYVEKTLVLHDDSSGSTPAPAKEKEPVPAIDVPRPSEDHPSASVNQRDSIQNHNSTDDTAL